jgi:DNA-binding transcriptional ArsR family regulator
MIDFFSLMNESTNSPKMTSAAGNTFVRYDLRIEGRDGFVSLNELKIEYDIELDAANSILFKPAIERALRDHGGERILLSIMANSAGTIRLGPVQMEYDSPPVVHSKLPGSVSVKEGEAGASLFNIRDHISDDFLLPQGLDVEIILEEGLPSDYLFMDKNGNIVSQPFKYPDLNGEFLFAFTVSDLRNTIQTENIALIIEPTQDLPELVGNINRKSVDEGSEIDIILSGEDGLFMDPDGDDLLFAWTVTNPQPLTLPDHIHISIEHNVLTLKPLISGMGGDFRLEIGVSDGIASFSDGPNAVFKIHINDVDSPPELGSNPGTIYLIEDQDTPSKIPLIGWFLDPDTSLSEYKFNAFSPNPYLDTYIKHIGEAPYLFLHPRGNLNGDVSVMLEMSGDGTNIMDRLKVKIEPVNDKPQLFVDGKNLLENRGWMVSGHVSDRDSPEGIVEYRIGDGEWISAWGYESWTLNVDFRTLPEGTESIFIFLRAYDHEEYSLVTYVKLPIPEDIPEPPEIIIDPEENDTDPYPNDPPSGNDNTGFTPTPSDDTDTPWALYGGLAGIIIAAIFFFGFTEVGMIIMATVGASIYSKLSKKDILNHEIRGLIRGYIIANPGDHYSSIKRNLDLNNGTLAYHLRVLEQSGFIKSMYDGIYKRYYPSNVNISKLKKNVSKQEEIFNIILDNPGVTMEEIGRMIGVSRQVVNYHVKNLIRAGVVSYQRDRKSAKFFPSDNGGNGFEQT